MNDLILSFILGLIQGLTEFLPISSSAHLLFPSLIFGSNDLGLAFDISAHAGTLFAVMYYFKDEIKAIIKSLFQSNSLHKEDKHLAITLIIATVPIILVGFFGVLQESKSFFSLIFFGIDFATLSQGCLLTYYFPFKRK